MFPPTTDPAEKQKADALDRWVQRQKEEAMRNLPTDLEVLPSPLLLEQMEREAVQRCSPPAPLAAHSGPAVKPSPSSRRKKRRTPSCGSAGEEVVSLPANIRAAANKPASSSATALSARLAAPPPMPSSLAPVQCSEATPDELEHRLSFYACQIKSFRTTSLMYSSPELVERIRQMERDYETAVRQFYCRSPSPTPSHMSGAAAQSTPCLQGAAAEQPMPGLQSAAAEQPTSGLQSAAAEQPTPGPQPDTPQPDSKPDLNSASTSSTRRRGLTEGLGNASASAHATEGLGNTSAHATEGLGDASASAHATEGLGDASAPAHATDGLGDTSAPAHATEGLGDASAPAHATEGPGDASASAHATEGLGDASAPVHATEGLGDVSASVHATESFILVLASEPRDEGFEDEAPSNPVPEGFKEQFVLVPACLQVLAAVTG
ncbi:hypothetical protein CRENBAI_002629 [Crenichthys baileyi]|uniref:Uncharacterized protein n=1 Tax=Crenichthys baileyi TaxID=28760 RepID=A0AAV9QS29_9TELE